MYIWVGINVDGQLSEIREATQKAESEIGVDNSNFTLPLHISLKISFKIEDELFDEVVQDIVEIYERVVPFDIFVDCIELHDNISWILMKRNENLVSLSDEINTLMLKKYNVPLYEYDLDYKFHTTLFMEDRCERVRAGYEKIKNIKVPSRLRAEKFLIGTSETGSLGTFKIYKEISVK